MIPCVTWDPDPKTKTITVTVRIDFYEVLRKSTMSAADIVARWVEQIESAWKGKFKCWDFRVKVEAAIVPDFKSVRSDRLDVAIDDRVSPAQTRTPGPKGRSLSDSPEDRLAPERSEPPDWSNLESTGRYSAWPTGTGSAAHEIGHVLGLDEGYVGDEEGTPSRLPGHVADIMSDPGLPVMPETITRLIRRHGGGIEQMVKCPLTFESGPSGWNLVLASLEGIFIHAWACDYPPPSNDPAHAGDRAEFKGTMHVEGEYLEKLDLPIHGSGQADIPVTFYLPVYVEERADGKPQLAVDAKAWMLRQDLWKWDEANALPVMLGPFIVHACENGHETPWGIDSSNFWPGPALWGTFKRGAKECPE